MAEASAAVRQAAEAVTKAARAVPDAVRMVDAAADKLAVAEASLAATRQPPDTGTARAQVAKARRDLADGTKEVMVVTTSRLAIDSSVPIPDAKLVKVGDKVAVVSTELGIEAAGVVTKLADKPGTNGVDAQKVYMELVPDNAPPELTGASVRLTIAVKSTDGEVLAVPVSALSMGPDGTSRVQVDTGGGATRTVPVEPGLSAEGYVEIRPKGSGVAIHEGDYVSVVGPSGSGKSTLLNILGCLDRPTAGLHLLDGMDVASLSEDQRAAVRGRRIGFVFQSFHLLAHRSVADNVMLAEIYTHPGQPRDGRRARAEAALARLGLSHRARFLPTRLSGGERQRVAIARVSWPSRACCC